MCRITHQTKNLMCCVVFADLYGIKRIRLHCLCIVIIVVVCFRPLLLVEASVLQVGDEFPRGADLSCLMLFTGPVCIICSGYGLPWCVIFWVEQLGSVSMCLCR